MTRPIRDPADRFFSKIEMDGDCWIWRGRVSEQGYGRFWVSRPVRAEVAAHRWSYEYFRSEIPDGLQIDHLCRRRNCVNAWHLEPVTGRVNLMRSPTGVVPTNLAKTHCRHGHLFDESNTRWYTSQKKTTRVCITCKRAQSLSRRVKAGNGLPPVRRPNGKLYWPRGLRLVVSSNEARAMVIGTHDEAVAIAYMVDNGFVGASVDTKTWTHTMPITHGVFAWVYDDVHGGCAITFGLSEADRPEMPLEGPESRQDRFRLPMLGLSGREAP